MVEAPRGGRRQLVWAVPAAVVAIAAAALPHLDVPAGGLVPVAQALLPVGAVALVVVAIVLLVVRRWAAGTVLLLGALLATLPTLTPVRTDAVCETSSTVTVVSFNAKFARADPARLADVIRSADADAVVLLETDQSLIDALLDDEGLGAVLPHRTREVSPGGVNGSAILSASPLSAEAEIPGSVFDQVSAVATLADGTAVRLAAVHPPPPVGQPLDWRAGLAAVDEWIEETPDERLIVAGDLNASYSHPAFRDLASPLRDAAEAAGPIPWPTWPEEKPVPAFTAIDHILARGAVPVSWDSVAVAGSDHRAVIGEWSLCADTLTR